MLETITFEEWDGQTRMIDLSVFQSIEDRDGMLQSGMEEGATASMDALAELVEERDTMTPRTGAAKRAGDRGLVITRVFDAPRELVWKAWTEPEHFMRWWGPKDYTTPVCKMDLRVGGQYLNSMRSFEGQDIWSTGVFREIVAPERLVMTDSFADEKGNIVPASHYGIEGDYPLEFLITVTFEEQNDRTKLSLRHAGLPAGKDREMAGAGWNESFDKLAEYLAKL